MADIKNDSTDRLFSAIAGLSTAEECYAFFEDLCTIKEIKDMAQRLDVARLLREGKSYQEISEQAGACAATISRVNRCLNYGAGGYLAALERMQEK